jgi:hypothetical protein
MKYMMNFWFVPFFVSQEKDAAVYQLMTSLQAESDFLGDLAVKKE